MMISREKASELLREAAELINGDRAQAYGPPEESFQNIAKVWSVWLDKTITPYDVSMMMVLLKVMRGKGSFHRDNHVDICGYASLGGSDEQLG